MDFLDQLIDPLYAHQTDQTEVTARRLGFMIAAALITSDERQRYEMIAHKLTEEQAKQLCDKLQDAMPQPGYHTIAQSQEDIKKAIRHAIEKDDYYHDQRHKIV
jgi:hypothetical protein